MGTDATRSRQPDGVERAILDRLNQTIILLAPDGSVQFFNRYAARVAEGMFGRTITALH